MIQVHGGEQRGDKIVPWSERNLSGKKGFMTHKTNTGNVSERFVMPQCNIKSVPLSPVVIMAKMAYADNIDEEDGISSYREFIRCILYLAV